MPDPTTPVEPDALIQPTVNVTPGGRIHGQIRVPGSKSLTNRAMIIAAMARSTDGKPSVIRGALASEDTEVMIDSLRRIGVRIEPAGPSDWSVAADNPSAVKDNDAPVKDLYIANSGTSVRFLTAMLSAIGGRYRLCGVDRMHARPIGDLIDALQPVVNGTVAAISDGRCPPVEIDSHGWNHNDLSVAGNVSSQYLSGLMMAAGGCPFDSTNARPRTIQIDGQLVSRPYVDMTAAVMRSFGCNVQSHDDQIIVPPGGYRRTDYDIEPDASAASYFWAAAAITGGAVTVTGLTRDALQGDVGVVDVLEQMGCRVDDDQNGITVTGGHLRGIDVDMNAISDTVQTVAPVALFADSPTRIRGVAHNRFKETDRIGDLATELRKFGSKITEHDDGLTIDPIDPDATGNVTLDTYDDHRMAMGLSLIGLRRPNVWIQNPACTKKTYPDYFADLATLAGRHWNWHSE